MSRLVERTILCARVDGVDLILIWNDRLQTHLDLYV
jgi:hypothetical protein